MNELEQLYRLAQTDQPINLEPVEPNYGWRTPFINWKRKREVDLIYKGIGERLATGLMKQNRAAEEGVVVNAALEIFGSYENAQHVREPTGITFQLCRQMYHSCEPLAAIINTRVRQAVRFARRPDMRRGYVKQPGFIIEMTHKSDKATPEDRARMEEITQFMLRCGSAAPPVDETPLGYQRSFAAFTAAVIRDSLTFDGVAVRRWKSRMKRPDGQPVVPIVAFAAEDAALIRKVKRPYVGLHNGVAVTKEWEKQRTNTRLPIHHVMETDDGSVVKEFTEFDLAYGIRNPRTDKTANGYGYSEVEQCINAVMFWIAARQSNMSRFDNDTLPRGILSIIGNLTETQFQSFKMQWHQLLAGGPNRRWNNPVYKSPAGQGAGLQWIPIDLSPRDMEQHQTMFTVAIWMHQIYGIHPEETGCQAFSPFRPPLSEASPESKLEYSQDSGLYPLMAWYEHFLNEEIIWKLCPDQKYKLKFVGLGQGDEAADVALYQELLNAGAINTRMVWHELDQDIPEIAENDPAMDMPGPIAANREYLLQLMQLKMSMDQQKQAMAQQQQAQQQQNMQSMAQQMQGGQPGQPPGQNGPPGQPGMPPGIGGPGPQPGEAPDADNAVMKALFDAAMF